MKQLQKISPWLTGSLIAISLMVALFFQNCGSAGFEAATKADNELTIGSTDVKVTTSPFAFEAAFDTISYMSCFGAGVANKEAFYTVKAGAYETGGVKITPGFIADARTKVPIVYPAINPDIGQIKSFLSETTANVGASPQLAIRERGNLNGVLTSGGGITLGRDYVKMLMDLTDDRMMDPMLPTYQGNVFANYFVGGSNDLSNQLRVLEGQLSFNSDEGMANSFRTENEMSKMMTLTFGVLDSSAVPRQPVGAPISQAYGRGYRLNFDLPGNAFPYAHEAVFASSNAISEVDLETGIGVAGASWSCADPYGNPYRFMIIAGADRASCPTDSADRLITDSVYAKTMEIVRRHLKGEYWDINIDRRCAVPKATAGDCYGNESNGTAVQVEYTPGAGCFNGSIPSYPNRNSYTKKCAQFVSFCVRQ